MCRRGLQIPACPDTCTRYHTADEAAATLAFDRGFIYDLLNMYNRDRVGLRYGLTRAGGSRRIKREWIDVYMTETEVKLKTHKQ